jgi:hypothetical protein
MRLLPCLLLRLLCSLSAPATHCLHKPLRIVSRTCNSKTPELLRETWTSAISPNRTTVSKTRICGISVPALGDLGSGTVESGSQPHFSHRDGEKGTGFNVG